ncbi:MAG: tetratricopeptide repeat protein [Bacteroidia bacterium]
MKINKLLLLALAAVVLSACASKKTGPLAGKKQEVRVLSEAERMEIDFLFFNAQKEKLIGNFGVAENLFLEIIKRDATNAQAYYEVGRTSLARQQLPRAQEYAAKAAALSPGNPWYLRLEADLLRQLGRQKESIAVLHRLSMLPDQDRAAILMDIALLYGEQNEYQEAIKVLNEVEKSTGPAPELAEQKRQYWLKLNKPDKAIDEIRRLSEASPLEADYLLYLGQLYFEKGDFDLARKQFEKALLLEPDNGKIYIALADSWRAKGNQGKSFEYLQKSFAFPDVDIDVKVQVLLSLFDDFDRNVEVRKLALELSKITVETHPEEAKAWAIRGDLMYHTRAFEAAAKAYKNAIDFDQSAQKYTVWQQYLLSLLETQQFQLLGTDGQKATELFPNQPVPYFLAGIALLQEKSYEPAIKILRSGVRMVYGNAELESQFYASLGDAYQAIKQFEESDASYDRALKIKPENALVLNNYAYYLSLRGERLDKAEEMSAKSLKLEPGNASYLDTYGWILYQQGRYAEAAGFMEQALAIDGNNGTLLEHYGDILYKMGKTEQAIDYWKRAQAAGVESDFINKKVADGKLYE